MNIGRALEAKILYTASDGRTVFRPWGKGGPCYVVEGKARRRFAIFVRVYYALLFAAILILPFVAPASTLYIAVVAWGAGFYAAFWFLSRGLPTTTTPPPPPTPHERRKLLNQLAHDIGRPVLWTLLCGSILMVAGGLFVLFRGFVVLGLFSTLFFAACGGIAVFSLRRIRAA